LPNVVQPVQTEVTVDVLTGVETKVTNDTVIIKKSEPIQNVVTYLEKISAVDKKSVFVSAVVKTSQ